MGVGLIVLGAVMLFAVVMLVRYVMISEQEDNSRSFKVIAESVSRLGIEKAVEENYIRRISLLPLGMRQEILATLAVFDGGVGDTSSLNRTSSLDDILLKAEATVIPPFSQNIVVNENRKATLQMEKSQRLAFDPGPGFVRMALASFSIILLLLSVILALVSVSLYNTFVLSPVFYVLIISASSCFVLGVFIFAFAAVLKSLDESRYLLCLMCSQMQPQAANVVMQRET